MILEFDSVYLSYTKDYYNLHDISFSVQDGQTMVVFGPVDSGKSSINRLIVGLEKAQMGHITINKIDIAKIDFNKDVSVGYIPSNGAFLEFNTINNNLKYVLKIRKQKKDEITIKVKNALSTYGLEIIKNKKIKDLTNFERIKVAFARLSLRTLNLIVIDDIFSGISDVEINETIKLIKELQKINSASLIVSTTNELIAQKFKGKMIELKLGSIISRKSLK